MSKAQRLKDLKDRFVQSMKEVASTIGTVPSSLTRDEYVRVSVDIDVADRLNKEELVEIGGFSNAKSELFVENNSLPPKVLILDIETAPLVSFTWGLFDQNVALNQIVEDWSVLSWSAKWLGSDIVMYEDTRNEKNPRNDKKILKSIWKLMDEADIIIGQNSKSFDIKKLNARFIMNGMQPPSSFRQIDTMRLAKKHFAFTSNKLEYMTKKLCSNNQKLSHSEFSGFELWKECLSGNKKAWESMREYNVMDILSTEELYNKLKAWDNSINFNVYSDSLDHVCTCDSKNFKKNGFVYTNNAKFQRFTCTKCGAESRSSTNLLSKEKRKTLKR